MRSYFWISILLFFLPASFFAQDNTVSGVVIETTENGVDQPLPGVVVSWLNSTSGVNTDVNGFFELSRPVGANALVFSLFGFANDTIYSNLGRDMQVTLSSNEMLDEVNVVYERKSTETSFLNPILVENINEKELQKAACCSLSESFETSPTIDVSFTDAVTGTRQIQMLGLAGPNIQINRESMPAVRGFNAIHGMDLIPGTWIESIHVNKGTGSVVNGFESIAGQMNVELRKPEDTDKFYVNLYGNQGGRVEGNIHFAKRINRNWSSGALLHARTNSIKQDRNNDRFMDMTIGNHYFGLNRWKYAGDNGLRFQFGIKGSHIDEQGGQLNFDPKENEVPSQFWGMTTDINRVEAWTKIGKVYKDLTWKSMGLQIAAAYHKQESYFGLTEYNAGQNSLYANYIYQSILSNTNHKFKAGASLYYDEYIENLGERDFDRTEIIPGTFFEYTYNKDDKFNLVAGIRGDHHNLFGAFVTPRLHLRFAPSSKNVYRAFIGRGQRTANVISENTGVLASSRAIVIYSDNSDKPYGLNPEIAWNAGFSYSRGFKINDRSGTYTADFYRTEFENQIVVDLDSDVHQVQFYNLLGKSFSNSLSTQIDYEISNNFDVRLAYRFYDVKTSYHEELLEKIFVSPNRAFVNVAYKNEREWKFDITWNWQDKKRLPNTNVEGNQEFQLDDYSPDFFNLNAQISKKWSNNFEMYLGMENIFNYTQENPIVDSANPFGEHFDASMIWGPIFGRMTYAGLRFRIK